MLRMMLEDDLSPHTNHGGYFMHIPGAPNLAHYRRGWAMPGGAGGSTGEAVPPHQGFVLLLWATWDARSAPDTALWPNFGV